jgi:hypothetical protein
MAQRKETKKAIKVRDLKPKKDAKGGFVCDRNNHSVQSHTLNVSRNQTVQGRNPTIKS